MFKSSLIVSLWYLDPPRGNITGGTLRLCVRRRSARRLRLTARRRRASERAMTVREIPAKPVGVREESIEAPSFLRRCILAYDLKSPEVCVLSQGVMINLGFV